MDPPRYSFLCPCHYLLAFTRHSSHSIFLLCTNDQLPSKTLKTDPIPICRESGGRQTCHLSSQPACLPAWLPACLFLSTPNMPPALPPPTVWLTKYPCSSGLLCSGAPPRELASSWRGQHERLKGIGGGSSPASLEMYKAHPSGPNPSLTSNRG